MKNGLRLFIGSRILKTWARLKLKLGTGKASSASSDHSDPDWGHYPPKKTNMQAPFAQQASCLGWLCLVCSPDNTASLPAVFIRLVQDYLGCADLTVLIVWATF